MSPVTRAAKDEIPSEPIAGDQPMIDVGLELAPSVPIYVALSNAMRDVQPVGKDSKFSAPGMGTFNFRGIDATVNAIGPALRRHGIVPLPVGQDITYRDTKTTGGKDTREVTVKARYRFVGPIGDYVEVEAVGESLDTGDKGTAKAMSVAFRVLLLQMFAVPTGDADPDSQVYERGGHDDEPRRDRPNTAKPPAKPETTPSQARLKAAYAARNLTWKETVEEYQVWRVDQPDETPDALTAATPPAVMDAFSGYLEALTALDDEPVTPAAEIKAALAAAPEPEPTVEETKALHAKADAEEEGVEAPKDENIERAAARNAKLQPKDGS